MAISSVSITITNPRVLDGFVFTLNMENENSEKPRSFEEFIQQHVEAIGRQMANSHKIGIVSNATIILRLTEQELIAIKTAATQSSELAKLLKQLEENPEVHLDDPRLLTGLQQLVSAGLLSEERIAELLHYERPQLTVIPEQL